MLKYLRIAVSVTCGIAWVASYMWYGVVWCGTRHAGIIAESLRGEFQLRVETNKDEYVSPNIGIRFEQAGPYENNYDSRQWNWGGFGVAWKSHDKLYPQLQHSLVGCPYWFLAIIVGAVSTTSWGKLPSRFSLRTLLIAMTLVAVLLGAIVAFAR